MQTKIVHTVLMAFMAITTCLAQVPTIKYKSPAPKGEIPIMAWGSIPANMLTDENFEALKEAGINVNFSFHRFNNVNDVKKLLRMSRKHGIKAIITCPELKSNPDSVIKLIKSEKGLAGYFLQDEPSAAEFDGLAQWADKIKKADPNKLVYLNLFPYMEDAGTLGGTYEEYVEAFINKVALPFVSWDIYPITTQGINPRWYENLEIIRKVCLRHNLPFWSFALSTPHSTFVTYPTPTIEQLRLQLYTGLAYGAQGLQYFTYWCPPPYDRRFDYHEAPISDSGIRTHVYELTRTVNREIQNRAFVFLGGKVTAVNHLGDKLPQGTTKLTTLPAGVDTLEVLNGGMVVSQITTDNRRFLVLVNHSWEQPVDLNLHFSSPARLIRKDGSETSANNYETLTRIAAGDVAIYEILKDTDKQ